MIAVTAEIDEAQLARVRKMLRDIPRAVPRVIRRSLNRSVTSVRGRLVKRFAEILPLKQTTIRSNMVIQRASYLSPAARIIIRGKGTPLIDLRARQTIRGVTYLADKAKGRELAESAFIAVMPAGHRGVYRRVGADRTPIRELYGPSLPGIFDTTPGLAKETEVDASATLAKRMDQEVAWELEKAAA